MNLNRRSISLVAIAFFAFLPRANAEQLLLTALGLRVEYRPENHWGPVFDRGKGGSPADQNTAMEVSLLKDGKSKSVLFSGSIVSKGSVRFDESILARVEELAQRKDYHITTKGVTKFSGFRAYKVASESPTLRRQVVLYCFYSTDKLYVIVAGSDIIPIDKDTEVQFILDSVRLIN